MTIWFLLLGLAAFAIYNYRKYAKQFRDIDKLPGPSTFRLLRELYYSSSSRGLLTKLLFCGEILNRVLPQGHDTSIIPLSMTFREMGRRPELQQKLLDEIADVIGEDITRQVTLADVDRMPYAQAVAKEAVRRFSPFPFLDRQTAHDMTIGGTRIPRGTRVMFDLPEILTAEENYVDGLIFEPERFLKENVTSRAQRAFVGFGYGGKICVGKYIAYAAMKLLIVKIVREFEILHVEHDVQLVAEFFFRSLTGVPVAFRKRTTN